MILSPIAKSVTEEPLATTVPAPSWEAVQGSGVPIFPEETIESVWQSDATATLIKRSCGARSDGRGI
jgi:hypothetical protein